MPSILHPQPGVVNYFVRFLLMQSEQIKENYTLRGGLLIGDAGNGATRMQSAKGLREPQMSLLAAHPVL